MVGAYCFSNLFSSKKKTSTLQKIFQTLVALRYLVNGSFYSEAEICMVYQEAQFLAWIKCGMVNQQAFRHHKLAEDSGTNSKIGIFFLNLAGKKSIDRLFWV